MPVGLGLRQRGPGFGNRRGQVAAQPRGLGARAANGRDALQRAARQRQREGFVQRLRGPGLAATRLQPAQRGQRHDAAGGGRGGLGDDVERVLACIVPLAQVQLAQRQPRDGVVPVEVDLVPLRERDGRLQVGLRLA